MHGLISLIRLNRAQWRNAEELSARRDAALAKLVRHAYNRVPYYHQLFDQAGVNPADIRTVADLARIPVTTKKDLQRLSLDERTPYGLRRGGWTKIRTGGTTGEPLEMIFGSADRARFSAAFLCAYLNWGIRPLDRLMVLEARPERLRQRSWYERLGLFRRLRLSALEPAERWIKALRSWKPRLVQGHAPTLKLLADAVKASGSDVRVPVVVNTGASLDPLGRRLIEDSLADHVMEIYASVEGGVMAWECPVCKQHHINNDSVVIELLDAGNPVQMGDAGTVVITSLENYVMPMIRYDQGDLAAMSLDRPACGRGLPLMKGVLGRVNDFIILPSNRRLSPHLVYVLMYDVALAVGEWQLVQQRDYSLDLTAVAAVSVREEMERSLAAGLRRILGDSQTIRFHWVDHIDRDPMEKMRCIVSHAPGGGGSPVSTFLQL
jgi:phenylacetate-CoA ligase